MSQKHNETVSQKHNDFHGTKPIFLRKINRIGFNPLAFQGVLTEFSAGWLRWLRRRTLKRGPQPFPWFPRFLAICGKEMGQVSD